MSLFPKEKVYDLSSASAKSWHYLGRELSHSIVYVQELNENTGSMHPARILISEGNLIYRVTERRGGRFVTVEHVTKGPIVCLSTTTSDRIKVDDETRAYSIWIDESREQTRRIMRAVIERNEQDGLQPDKLLVWHAVQKILGRRAAWPITIPKWLMIVADQARADDISMRRYFPAFLNACEVVCLLRSYVHGNQEKLRREETLSIRFADYATTWFIFNSIVGQSLGRAGDQETETLQQIEKIVAENGGKPVQARDLARTMRVSNDRAYDLMRGAEGKGLVRRANAPERTNRKFYLPSPVAHFAPDPASVFRQLDKLDQIKFVHPITGKLVAYKRDKKQTSDDDDE